MGSFAPLKKDLIGSGCTVSKGFARQMHHQLDHHFSNVSACNHPYFESHLANASTTTLSWGLTYLWKLWNHACGCVMCTVCCVLCQCFMPRTVCLVLCVLAPDVRRRSATCFMFPPIHLQGRPHFPIADWDLALITTWTYPLWLVGFRFRPMKYILLFYQYILCRL